MRTRHAFTLIELLIVIAIIALLIGILLPTLKGSRDAARRISCLANMRSLEIAHWAYAEQRDGTMLGTSHAGSWIDSLREIDQQLLLRSPLDESPHFPEDETPVNGEYRLTSYSINFWLSPDNPLGYPRLDRVERPSATGHFVIAAFEGDGAVQDHVHPSLWHSPIPGASPGKAAAETQINAHGGEPAAPDSRSAYGFLDGHADSLPFNTMFIDNDDNRFDPRIAH